MERLGESGALVVGMGGPSMAGPSGEGVRTAVKAIHHIQYMQRHKTRKRLGDVQGRHKKILNLGGQDYQRSQGKWLHPEECPTTEAK